MVLLINYIFHLDFKISHENKGWHGWLEIKLILVFGNPRPGHNSENRNPPHVTDADAHFGYHYRK